MNSLWRSPVSFSATDQRIRLYAPSRLPLFALLTESERVANIRLEMKSANIHIRPCFQLNIQVPQNPFKYLHFLLLYTSTRLHFGCKCWTLLQLWYIWLQVICRLRTASEPKQRTSVSMLRKMTSKYFDFKAKLKVPYHKKHIFSGLSIYKLVLPEPANSQNEENKGFRHGLCSPSTGNMALLQAVQILLLSLCNKRSHYHRPASTARW